MESVLNLIERVAGHLDSVGGQIGEVGADELRDAGFELGGAGLDESGCVHDEHFLAVLRKLVEILGAVCEVFGIVAGGALLDEFAHAFEIGCLDRTEFGYALFEGGEFVGIVFAFTEHITGEICAELARVESLEAFHCFCFGLGGETVDVLVEIDGAGIVEVDSVGEEYESVFGSNALLVGERVEVVVDNLQPGLLVLAFLQNLHGVCIHEFGSAFAALVASSDPFGLHFGVEGGIYFVDELLAFHITGESSHFLTLVVCDDVCGVSLDLEALGQIDSFFFGIVLHGDEFGVHEVAYSFFGECLGRHLLAWAAPVGEEINEDEFVLVLGGGACFVETDVTEFGLCRSGEAGCAEQKKG